MLGVKKHSVNSKLSDRWKLLSSPLSASFKAREPFPVLLMISNIKIAPLHGEIFAESCLGKPSTSRM